jgi:hypothetical protein
VRAELSRLRKLLGTTLGARPYRMTIPVETDFAVVERLALAGRVGQALELYGESLLPRSDAPLVVETRERLDGILRNAVMASADPELVAGWCATASGRDDQPAAELLLGLLPAHDSRYAGALARAERLRRRASLDALPAAW